MPLEIFFFLLQEGRYLFESATMHLIYFDGLNRARTLLLHQVNRAVAIQYMRKHLMEAISCVLHVRKGNGGPVSPDIVWTSWDGSAIFDILLCVKDNEEWSVAGIIVREPSRCVCAQEIFSSQSFLVSSEEKGDVKNVYLLICVRDHRWMSPKSGTKCLQQEQTRLTRVPDCGVSDSFTPWNMMRGAGQRRSPDFLGACPAISPAA